MPEPHDPQRRSATIVADQRGAADGAPLDASRNSEGGAHYDHVGDVVAAREAVRRAGVTYGSRTRRPPRHPVADWVRGFIDRYGWRAYALPVLAVVTVVALTTTTAVSNKKATAAGTAAAPVPVATGSGSPPVAKTRIPLKNDAPTAGVTVDNSALKAAALPAGPSYTVRGKGTYRILKGNTPAVGKGKLYRYSIDVENGINDVNLALYARLVSSTLADPRSWSGHGVSLQRVDHGFIDFHVSLTTAMTIRHVCGYSIPVETSCYAPSGSVSGIDVNRASLNYARWVRGDAAYVGDLNAYQLYMINHEFGHALGHRHAHQCLSGGLAPVMMQQTIGLRSAATGKNCGANPWPYPPGAAGAPGAEQADTSANDEYGLTD